MSANRARALFVELVANVPPEQWDGRLADWAGEDQELRDKVARLLAAHREEDSFLDRPAASLGGTVEMLSAPGWPGEHQTQAEGTERPGLLIAGRYKLLEQVGEGGMGTVWMAQQTEPVKRLVALKVIKPGMDSKQVLARFEAERQALALMDHPNIAKVFDAGTTAAGRPYFVMELVKGVPITRYCDERRLLPRERLELLIPVCQAIQHAHQKGVIHRDVKPSNVLVALYDGQPVPKVIDFGIAKAAGQQLTDLTLVTGFGAVVGTLEYMSPEQAELNQLDIDTRSDVYSLGVLLYELLTGTTPLERKRFKRAAMLEVLRLIREEEAQRPSTRLSATDELPSVAANRGLEPRKLSGLVRGELDWIVMKALEKDRNRRYETASALAADVRRYLDDEPVVACPPGVGYRLRKFLRRNKRAVLATSVFVFLLLASIVGVTTGLVRALAAEQETGTALAQVTAEQAKTQAALTAARAALDVLTDDVVETMFVKQPQLEETEIAFLRKVLALYEASAQQFGDTAEGRLLRARGSFKMAHLRALLGENANAVAGYRQALDLLGQLAADFPKVPEHRQKLAAGYNNMGILLADLGKGVEAEKAFRQAVDLRTKLVTDFPKVLQYRRELANGYNDLGNLLRGQENYADAEKAYRLALELKEKLVADAGAVGAYHVELARSRSNMAQLLQEQRKYGQAEQLYHQALDVQQKQVDEFPAVPRSRRELADSYHGLGIVLAELRKGTAAETAFHQAVDLRTKLVNDFPKVLQYRRELANGYFDLGFLLGREGKFAEAETAHRKALELREKLANDSPKVPDYRNELAGTLGNLAMLHNQNREFTAAVALLEQARPHHQAALEISPKNPRYRMYYRNNLQTLAQSHLGLADHARLAVTADELARCGCDPANDSYLAACCLCSCVMLADKDARLTRARSREVAQGYADRALTLLGQAVARGFNNVIHLKKNPDLEPLRTREEFRKLLADLEGKTKE